MTADPPGGVEPVPTPSTAAVYCWADGDLTPLDHCDPAPSKVLVADSWFVADGRVLAIALHRERFLRSLPPEVDGEPFWDAVLRAVPREGEWFPRVELVETRGSRLLVFRQRSAPVRSRSVRLATSPIDPRTRPTVKGPDLAALSRLRTAAQTRGADEAVILSPDGVVVEGGYSALVWWRGDRLHVVADSLPRIDSVTERSLRTLAVALGTEVVPEVATPAELEGLELWAVSALHGIRIVTAWIDGPQPAEEPGRLAAWRERLGRLARPLDTLAP